MVVVVVAVVVGKEDEEDEEDDELVDKDEDCFASVAILVSEVKSSFACAAVSFSSLSCASFCCFSFAIACTSSEPSDQP